MEPWLLSWLQMVALITGILGQWLVARRRRSAFLVWSVSNVVLIWLQLVQGLNVLVSTSNCFGQERILSDNCLVEIPKETGLSANHSSWASPAWLDEAANQACGYPWTL